MKRTIGVCVATPLVLVCLAGCVITPSIAASRIKEADASMVSGCTYVGEVYGTSGVNDPEVGIANAKTQALEQAASKRATHVVWNSLVADRTQPNVSGKAYRCPDAAPPPLAP